MTGVKISHCLSDDGLITPEIGNWGEHKYLLVSNFACIFASSMKEKWQCRVYIDLFAGAGRSQIEKTSKIVPASPLLALDIPNKFNLYIFCEKDESKIISLKQRVERDYAGINVEYVHGDSNLKVDEIISKIPQHSKNFKVLAFCFADPYNLKSLKFSTIQHLSKLFMDFLILIPTGMDANRNLKAYYLKPSNTTIEEFLGDSNWRKEWEKVSLVQSFDVFLTNSYGHNMQELGYHYSGIENTKMIRSTEKNLPLYRLTFFSRHNLGDKFWNEAKKYSDPQLKLFY